MKAAGRDKALHAYCNVIEHPRVARAKLEGIALVEIDGAEVGVGPSEFERRRWP